MRRHYSHKAKVWYLLIGVNEARNPGLTLDIVRFMHGHRLNGTTHNMNDAPPGTIGIEFAIPSVDGTNLTVAHLRERLESKFPVVAVEYDTESFVRASHALHGPRGLGAYTHDPRKASVAFSRPSVRSGEVQPREGNIRFRINREGGQFGASAWFDADPSGSDGRRELRLGRAYGRVSPTEALRGALLDLLGMK